MKEERQAPAEGRDTISPAGYRFVVIWVAGLLILYAAGGYFGARQLHSDAAETAKARQARIESPSGGLNAGTPDAGSTSTAKPVPVLVGCSIKHIDRFDLKDPAWTMDFALWFSWNSRTVNPGESFRIVNGRIRQKEREESYRSGERQHAVYRVTARIERDFDGMRFPFGEAGLVIQVEDAAHGAETLRYVADKRNSGIDRGAMPPGLKPVGFITDVKTVSPFSGRDRPDFAAGKRDLRSRFMAAMLVVPDSLGIYQKMFQALFASVAIALVTLFIKPIHVDPRFGLPVGGFFAAVGNNVFISMLLPYSNRHTLTDMVNAAGLFTIFFILVQSAASLYIFDSLGRERLSRLFDRASFAIFLLGYVGVNLALPLAARPL
jgi:hypothetical protein